MLSFWSITGATGHALAAALFAALAILTSRRRRREPEFQLLIVALALTALWSLRHALDAVLHVGPLTDGIAETMRNGAWLALVAVYMRRLSSEHRLSIGHGLLVTALGLLLLTQLGFDLLVGAGPLAGHPSPSSSLQDLGWLLRCMFALGGLVLLHGLSERRDHPWDARREAWIAAGLAFMWAYDFNYYILTWLTGNQTAAVGAMRGFVTALLAVPIAVGLRADGRRRFALSRTMALRLVSIGVVIGYVLLAMLLVAFSRDMSAPLGRIAQISLLFGLSVFVLALLPSATLRSWLRVEITKHLFAHRYDYRSVWLGFAAQMGDGHDLPESLPQSLPESLDERITRAIAEVIGTAGAALYLRDEANDLVPTQDWRWRECRAAMPRLSHTLVSRLEPRGWIIDVAADWHDFADDLPAWMQQDGHVWAVAPLVHRDHLLGVILLAPPPDHHRLDWEDLDVLRVVCGEAAARLSEARGRIALAEAQRFEEFNKRFAFILHDIKNLTSQLSLLASNAQRHAGNPAFHEDMILTLQETATRMTDLLQRLGRPATGNTSATQTVALGALVRALQPGWTSENVTVELVGDVRSAVQAHPDDLARALGNLMHNAMEASPPGAVVRLELGESAGQAMIAIADAGPGMSEAFIRNELFRPFTSTKSNGFGLGAHEARALLVGMGGALDVESQEGQGTCFTIRLPLAGTDRLGPQAGVTDAGDAGNLRKAV